jgi:hypothetical protein
MTPQMTHMIQSRMNNEVERMLEKLPGPDLKYVVAFAWRDCGNQQETAITVASLRAEI